MTYQQPDGQQPYGQPSYGQQPYGQPSYAQQPQQNTGTGTNTGAGAPGASHTGYPANYNYNTYIPPKAEPALGLPWYGIPFPKAVARFFKKYATFSGILVHRPFQHTGLFCMVDDYQHHCFNHDTRL